MLILKNSFIFLFGEVLNKSIPFLFIPYLSHKLGTSGYGVLAYYLSIIQLIYIVVNLGFQAALTRYFFRYGKRSILIPIISHIIYSIFVLLVIAFIVYVFDFNKLIIFAGGISFLTSIFNVTLSIMQCEKKPLLYIIAQLTFASLSVVLTVAFFKFIASTVILRLLSVAISYLAIIIACIIIYTIKKENKNLRGISITRIYTCFRFNFSYGVGLIFHTIANYIKTDLDKIIIFQYFSSHSLGAYSIGAKVGSLSIVVLLAINKAIQPILFEKFKNKEYIPFEKIMKISLIFIPLPSMILYLLPQELYEYIFNADIKYYVIMFVLSGMIMIPYFICTNMFFYYARLKSISIMSVVSSIIYLSTMVFVSKNIGVEAIPLASIFASIVMSITFIILSYKNKFFRYE